MIVKMPDLLMPGQDLGDAPATPAAPNGMALLIGLVVGGAYWWMAQRQKASQEAEDEEEDNDEGDEEDDDDDERFEPHHTERLSRARLSDVTTDSLLDEPAILASRGKPGDCFKAVKMIAGRQGLATSAHEKSIFKRVLRKVSNDCSHAEEEVEDALTELETEREEVEEVFGPTSQSDNAPRQGSRGTLHEPGFRKSKKSLIRKTSAEGGDARSKGRTRAGRPRGASFIVRKPGAAPYRVKREAAKTKRGFKYRKEEI